MAKKKTKKSTRKKTPTQAQTADKHALYEIAVQQPVLMVEFVEHIFEEMVGREPLVMREDFCGTANLSSTWVRSHPDRRAIGVDLDAPTLQYAQQHAREPLGPDAKRLKLVEADVLDCHSKADALLSLYFSHFIYKTRDDFLRYLKHARRCVKPGGVMILDMYGGPGAIRPCNDYLNYGDFDYAWQQESYDAVTSEVVNHIHFRFPDGSVLERAFTYDWRLWTIVEMRELLADAGFADVGVCFEHEEGFVEEIDTEDLDAWVGYVVAMRD
jgi:SAM-dependent methyltransferase